jgi:hypothetical protein
VYAENTLWFLLLLVVAGAIVGVFRRLPPEYGAYCLTAVLIPSRRLPGWEPHSFPRLVAVIFPLFIWLGLVWKERPVTRPVIGVIFLIGLLAGTSPFATWHWVA